MLMRMRFAALAGVLVASGCGGAGRQEVFRNEEVPVELKVSMKGDVNFEFHKTVNSRFIVRRTKAKDNVAQRSQVVGAETAGPVQHGGAAFLAGVAVLPYEGDGEYTIPVGSPLDQVHQAKNPDAEVVVGSSIKVEWWGTGDTDADPELYMRRARPCDVVVKSNGTRGTVTCPDVTNEAQTKHFAFTFSWVAPRTPAPSSTPAG